MGSQIKTPIVTLTNRHAVTPADWPQFAGQTGIPVSYGFKSQAGVNDVEFVRQSPRNSQVIRHLLLAICRLIVE